MSKKKGQPKKLVEVLTEIVDGDSEKLRDILVAMHNSMSDDYKKSLMQYVVDEGFSGSVQPLIVSNLAQAINEVTVASSSLTQVRSLLEVALQHIDVARKRLIREIKKHPVPKG